MAPRPLSPVVRRVVGAALAVWVAVLAFALLSPSAEGPSWLVNQVAATAAAVGVPSAFVAGDRVEFLLNVAAFVPVSLLGSLLWQRLSWRDWTAGGFVASFLVELVQAVALDGRSATHADVVSNTVGALVGAVLGGWLLLARQRLARQQRRSEGRADLPDRLAATE